MRLEDFIIIFDFLNNKSLEDIEKLNNNDNFNEIEKDFLSYFYLFFLEEFKKNFSEFKKNQELKIKLQTLSKEKEEIVKRIIKNIEQGLFSSKKNIEQALLNCSSKDEINQIFTEAGIKFFYYKKPEEDFFAPFFSITPGKFFETYKLLEQLENTINKIIEIKSKIKPNYEIEFNIFLNNLVEEVDKFPINKEEIIKKLQTS